MKRVYRMGLPLAKKLFPPGKEISCIFGFDLETKYLKVNIYYKDDNTFVVSFLFDQEEENRLFHLLLGGASFPAE